jgi:hypothetical protein
MSSCITDIDCPGTLKCQQQQSIHNNNNNNNSTIFFVILSIVFVYVPKYD